MEFRIADTFTGSLARLTGDEQKAVKMTAFDLQLNPKSPGMQFHKLENAKDKNFWSLRVNRDIRLIVHRVENAILVCYVDHHDKAYAWAERRKVETHPKTGAAQFVEIRERVEEYHQRVEAAKPAKAPKRIFAKLSDDELLDFGVPTEWVEDVKQATEESWLDLADHLPAEASEALLQVATGGKARAPQSITTGNPFEHPDAQRRFRIMSSADELRLALEYPWDKWTVFLHPDQRQTAERDYAGPARVSGSAGTGKTIVALHRAGHLARTNPDARVLLTTYSNTLANALQSKLRVLLANEPKLAERIDVHSLTALGMRLHRAHVGQVQLATRAQVRDMVKEAAEATAGHNFKLPFLWAEWEHLVDPWQLDSWKAYREVARLGRKTRIAEVQREVLWSIFEKVHGELAKRKLTTESGMFGAVTQAITNKHVIFDFAVVDEAQDLGVAHVRFLAALGGGRPNALFFAGDLGQRIFQQPFSWAKLGIDVRGRSRTLRVNYRTSHQIRSQADRLLDGTFTDADENVEKRNDTVSVFNGPAPIIQTVKNAGEETEWVSQWLAERSKAGILPHEMGVFVRSNEELLRAKAAVEASGMPSNVLDEDMETVTGRVSVGTMHLAKGLEFRAVVVMACDDDVIPMQSRLEEVGDMGDMDEVYDTERQLLYVACTRARDDLLVTAIAPGSEFLVDLTGAVGKRPAM